MNREDVTAAIRRLGGVGILNDDDILAFKAAQLRVFALMSDGEWHHPDEIELAAGQNGKPAREGLRRMRELRIPGKLEVEKVRVPSRRLWCYRLRVLT